MLFSGIYACNPAQTEAGESQVGGHREIPSLTTAVRTKKATYKQTKCTCYNLFVKHNHNGFKKPNLKIIKAKMSNRYDNALHWGCSSL